MAQEVMATRARRELAEANFRRVEPLFRDGITSEKDFLAAKQALAEAKMCGGELRRLFPRSVQARSLVSHA